MVPRRQNLDVELLHLSSEEELEMVVFSFVKSKYRRCWRSFSYIAFTCILEYLQ